MWRRAAAIGASVTAVLSPVVAAAAEPPSRKLVGADWEHALAERRCGFNIGLTAGAMVGEAEGYPNDSEKIDRAAYFTETGIAGGGQGSLWVGVAVADWFNFGLVGHYGRLLSSDHQTVFFGGGFHVDAFPAYGLGGEWRELGFDFEAGVAASTTAYRDAPDVGVIESGGASRIGLGAFYEGVRLWRLSMGPFVGFDQIWSPSAYRPAATIGWRTALYVGP